MMRSIHYSLPALLLVTACTIKGVSLTASIDTTETGETSGGATDPTTGEATDGTTTSQISGDPSGSTTDATTDAESTGEPGLRPLDILFIVDNSGSMAEEQSRLAASATALLAAAGDRDLRLGITTTDNGNPRCPQAQTTPEAGALSTASCRARVDAGEFMFLDEDLSSACTEQCPHQSWTIAPTPTAEDPVAKPRPWFERTAGVANVDVPLVEAIACAMPQGVTGCGFESPLEAMWLATSRARTPGEPQFGFLRPEADLMVVILTDEMDCSSSIGGQEIFTTNKIFWNDPSDPGPTSAVCYRAGVQCQITPDGTTCSAIDRDVTGAVTGDPGAAVLVPVTYYTSVLEGLQEDKTGGATVQMIVIAGVPPGFEDSSAELDIDTDPAPPFDTNFGVGPGCVDGDNYAIPPLRLLDVGQGFGAAKFFSICEPSFDKALAAAAL